MAFAYPFLPTASDAGNNAGDACDRSSSNWIANQTQRRSKMKTMPKLAAGLLVAFLTVGGAYAAESAGEAVSDTWITTKVKGEFAKDKDVSATHIHVKTTEGVVTLSGTAKNQAEIDKATDVANKIKGVKSVVNNVQLKS
jgi:hyperosmotically inducible periplasmic protein